jgi:hypothetical protein
MKKSLKTIAVLGLSLVAGAAMADGTTVDTTALTNAFSATPIITGVMAIAGTLATVYVTIRVVKTVLGMMRGR